MEPISIVIAMLIMTITMLSTGFVVSKFIVKECSLQERIAFSVTFGTLFIYLIYLLLKDNLMLLSQTTILAILFVIFGVYFLKHGFGTKIVGWLLTQRRE